MPRRKLTLDDAFKVIAESGAKEAIRQRLNNEKAIEDTARLQQLSDFVEEEYVVPHVDVPKRVSNTKVRITLYSQHSISCGGYEVVRDGMRHIEGNGVESYGPGTITVTAELAEHLLYQDTLARRADDNMLDSRQKTYVVGAVNNVHRGILVDDSGYFDMSSFINSNTIHL